MKKKILSMFILGVMAMGVCANAEEPQQVCPNSGQPREQVRNNGRHAKMRYKRSNKQYRSADSINCRLSRDPFTGLNLTDEQQKRIGELKKEHRAVRAENARKQKAAREEYMSKVKEILTPEQYASFVSNQNKKTKQVQRMRNMQSNRKHSKKASCKNCSQECGSNDCTKADCPNKQNCKQQKSK